MDVRRRNSSRGLVAATATAIVLVVGCEGSTDEQPIEVTGELGRPASLPARPVAPLSGAIVGSRRPVFRWQGPARAVGVVCRDRQCGRLVSVFIGFDGTARPLRELPAGPLFWRVLGGDGRWSNPWELFVPAARGSASHSILGFRYDANADGFVDAVVREVRQGPAAELLYDRLHVYSGAPTGIDAARQTVIENAGQPVVAGDVNGDGYGDLAVPLSNNSGLAIFAGGPGGISLTPLSVSTGSFTPVLALGDFNGDGYGDLVADRSTNTVAVFLGSASGLGATPAVELTIPGGFMSTSVLTAGDVNGDGQGDIVIGRFDSDAQTSQLGVALGGPGSILEGGQPSFFPVSLFPQRGTIGDVNGDGVGDLVTTSGGTADVYFGGPGGIAPPASQSLTFFLPGASVIHSLAVGDFNGDGAFDLAAAIGTFGPILFFEDDRIDLHLGSPAGLQLAVARSLVETDYFPDDHNNFGAHAVAAGDLDGDGRDDLLVGASTVFPPPLPDGFPLGPSSAFVFRGASDGLSPTPAPRLEGEPGFGRRVAVSTPGISVPGL